MSKKKQVPLMLSIPEEVRDRLRIMAAQKNLKNPSRVTSASTIAKKIVCESIEGITRVRRTDKDSTNCGLQGG